MDRAVRASSPVRRHPPPSQFFWIAGETRNGARGRKARRQALAARRGSTSSMFTGVEVCASLFLHTTSVALTKTVIVSPQRGQRHTYERDLPEGIIITI